jgi:hypothetical protein
MHNHEGHKHGYFRELREKVSILRVAFEELHHIKKEKEES